MRLPTPVVPATLTKRIDDVRAEVLDSRGDAPEPSWLLSFMTRDGPALLRLLWRSLGNQQDVLDAYQECLLRLLARGTADKPPPRRYVFQTALHIALDMRRRRRVRDNHMFPLASERPLRGLTSRTPRPSYVELMDRLREAIDALPPRLREVIILRDLAEMPYRDVSRVLGLSVPTTRVYRHEAITRLMSLLKEQ
jgi:RNA polymerase sigma factor (sigma-70 family)